MPRRWITHFKRSRILPRILAGFVILAAMLGVGLVVTSVQFNTLNAEFNGLLEHDIALVDGIERLHELLITLQSSKRAYLLTGDQEFLDRFTAAQGAVPTAIAQLRGETSARSVEQRDLDTFAEIVQRYIEFAEPEIALRQRATRGEVPLDAVVDLVRHNNGYSMAESGQRAIVTLHDRALRAVAQQQRVVLEASALSRRVVVLTMVLALLVALSYGSMLSRDLGQALLGLRESIDAMARGERVDVPDRNDEIGDVTRSFDQMADRLAVTEQQLRSKVEEQVSTLAQLTETNAALAQAMRVKSDFLATMSHELRTPLNAVIGLSALLLDSPRESLSPRARRSLESMRASGEHLLRLLNDILDLAKAEAGFMTLAPSRVRVSETIERVVAEAQALSERKVEFVIETTAGECAIETDPQRLEQVLANLITNAARLSGRGKVVVRVKADEATLRVEVHDDGDGILPEAVAGIFDEFAPIQSESIRGAEGAGLGLALSRRMARLMGGDISVLSNTHKGSAFMLSLPLAERARSASEAT